ncbi:MBL fold metallo-hydrolase [Acinetobacter dispersus]|uniref:MBL fold metallo-hydrolase n=1 Tax=Acinetobacter dispersus TaxID=70348 RepID=UPI00132F4923|nr:MBL fold metallo-hydrolase [Acinetobacter dispersus]QHH96998.1 MBL fold metallo-hydrolase [Acinetobacter dispersus]
MKIKQFLTFSLIALSGFNAYANSNQITESRTQYQLTAAPIVEVEKKHQIASGVWLIPDPYINYVPNIGIIEGKDAILVIDTGMGQSNGQNVYQVAKDMAKNRKIYLTTTHFHPEHQFGASEFKDATYIINKKQNDELIDKGEDYLKMFRAFGKIEKNALENVKLRYADQTYTNRQVLDLGGRLVTLQEMPAHTPGDQIIYDQRSGVIFMGDLYEREFYPIMPDEDSKGSQWIKVIQQTIDMKPKIVVPGHGKLSTVKDLQEFKQHMLRVKSLVNQQIDLGLNQNQIIKKISPTIYREYPQWNNRVFLPFQIANFYAELTKQSIVLRSLVNELQSDPAK